MKTILCVLAAGLFLTPLPAQEGRELLERAVVVEEQERDLAEARALYRGIATDEGHDAGVRAKAWLRLGKLLRRLDRDEEATGALRAAADLGGEAGERAKALLEQDPQEEGRETELRARARELLEGMRGFLNVQTGRKTAWFHQALYLDSRRSSASDAAKDLLWIGQPAAVEARLALDRRFAEWKRTQAEDPDADDPVRAIRCGVLILSIGGAAGEELLDDGLTSEDVHFRRLVARSLHGRMATDQLVQKAAGFLDDPDPEVVIAATWHGQYHGLYTRYPATEVVRLVGHPEDRVRLHILQALATAWKEDNGWSHMNHTEGPEATADALVEPLSHALHAADPAIGRAATEVLMNSGLLLTHAGRRLILGELPELPLPDARIGLTGWDRMNLSQPDEHVAELVAMARKLGRYQATENETRWKQHLIRQFLHYGTKAWGPEACEGLLELADLGYGEFIVSFLVDRAPDSLSLEIVRRIRRFPDPDPILEWLAHQDLAEAAFPHLRDLPRELVDDIKAYLGAVARTGAEGALECIDRFTTKGSSWRVWGRVRLSFHRDVPAVRRAMRETVLRKELDSRNRGWLWIRLAELGDEELIPDLGRLMALMAVFDDEHIHAPEGSGVEGWILPLHMLMNHRSGQEEIVFHGYGDDALRRCWSEILTYQDRALWRWVQPSLLRRSSPEGGSYAPAIPATVIPVVGEQLERWLSDPMQEDVPGGTRLLGVYLPETDAARSRVLRLALLRGSDDTQQVALRWLEIDSSERLSAEMLSALETIARSDSKSAAGAVEMLMKHDPKRARSAIPEALQNPRRFIRQRIFSFDEEHGDLLTFEQIEGALDDPHPSVAQAACNAMARRADRVERRHVDALLEVVRTSQGDLRQAAKDALEIIRLYREEQAYWSEVFAGTGGSPAQALLGQAAPDQPKEKRLMAIRSLGALGKPEVLPVLIGYSEEDDADIARAAKAAVERILEARDDEDGKD